MAYLTDALVELGHDVTLFASGDSVTKAKLAPIWPRALRLDPSVKDHFAPLVHAIGNRRAPRARVRRHPFAPGLFRLPAAAPAGRRRRSLRCTAGSICRSCRRSTDCMATFRSSLFPIRSANRCRTPTTSRPCCTGCRNICWKRAREAAGIWPFSAAFHRRRRRMRRSGSRRKRGCRSRSRPRSIGSMRSTSRPRSSRCSLWAMSNSSAKSREHQKQEFLGNAAALLFPIAWREPFGLVMIEAMACGTPVIAFENGSVPEVLEDGRHRLHRAQRGGGRRGGAADRLARPRPHPRRVRPPLYRASHGAKLPQAVFALGQDPAHGHGSLSQSLLTWRHAAHTARARIRPTPRWRCRVLALPTAMPRCPRISSRGSIRFRSPHPTLIKFNQALASELGLDAESLDGPQLAAIFSGNSIPQGAEPIAMAYAGHQFGQFVPQLGDGRAILLGEVIDRLGRRRDIQLKGAGRTPFSRNGDGRAALGPGAARVLGERGDACDGDSDDAGVGGGRNG